MPAAESRSTLIGDRSGWADADGLGLEQGRLMQAVLRMAVMAAGSSIGIGLLVLWLVHPVISGAQRWMLLWFHPGAAGERGRWLWAEAASEPARWHLLRCALYLPLTSASVGAPPSSEAGRA